MKIKELIEILEVYHPDLPVNILEFSGDDNNTSHDLYDVKAGLMKSIKGNRIIIENIGLIDNLKDNLK